MRSGGCVRSNNAGGVVGQSIAARSAGGVGSSSAWRYCFERNRTPLRMKEYLSVRGAEM